MGEANVAQGVQVTERPISVRLDPSERGACEGFRGLLIDTLEDRGRAHVHEERREGNKKPPRRKVMYR